MTTKNLLYNGSLELMFDSFRHKYTVGDESIPSVTTILSVINKPMLVNWAANTVADYINAQLTPGVPLDELQIKTIVENARKSPYQKKVDAGQIGTFLHQWVEDYIHGTNPVIPVNEDLKKSVEQFLSWVSIYNVKFLASEQMVYSKQYRFCGTLDAICTIDGKMYIVDLKTSSGIYSEYYMQTAAYRYARVEEFPEEQYDGMMIIRIGKDGTFERGLMKDDGMYRRMFDGFIAAKNLHSTLDRLKDFKPEKN